MKGEYYQEMNSYLSSTKQKSTMVKSLHDILPVIMMISYPMQLFYLLFKDGFITGLTSVEFLKFTLIPLALLILITIIRHIYNAKRPYEVYDFEPVVKNKTVGRSFPSRHTASAFIIAMAFLYLNTKLGVIMLILATLTGVTRVISGAHFIKDVVGGAVISIIFGAICFFLI